MREAWVRGDKLWEDEEDKLVRAAKADIKPSGLGFAPTTLRALFLSVISGTLG